MVEDGIKEGKQIDEKKVSDYIKNMKLESQRSQELDSKKANDLLANELLEQSPGDSRDVAHRKFMSKHENILDNSRNEIIDTTAGNGKLDKKEIDRLNSKDELWYK